MTFLHKLARRLASFQPSVIFTILAFVACSTPEEREFLSPSPGQPQNNPIVTVQVSPEVASVRPGELVRFSATAIGANGSAVPAEFDWSSTGGSVGSDGSFTSATHGLFGVTARVKSNPLLADSSTVSVYTTLQDVIQLRLSPDSSIMIEGEGLQLTAFARLADGRTTTTAPVTWAGTGGQVTSSGYFTTQAVGDYQILATADGGVVGLAAVRVKPRGSLLSGVSIEPEQVRLEVGGSVAFAAVAKYFDGSEGAVNVSWSASGGSISGQGFYTASRTGTFRVIAKYKSGSFADTAFVTVSEPTIVSLEVSPSALDIAPNGTHQYAATARMSDGSTKTVGANWRATGGTISSTGLYTATSTNGDYRVIGEVAGTSLIDTSEVHVAAAEASLTELVLNPSAVQVASGGTRQFSVSALYSDGSTRAPAVSFEATGGTITTGGLYTAGPVAGSFRVIAVESVSGKADTAAVEVTPPALVGLAITPEDLVLLPGATAQLVVSGSWSDGSSSVPAVSWTASGGTIGSGGLYTAGSVAGNFRIIGLHAASGLADTVQVAIESAPAVLTQLTLSPASVTVAPGGTQQFTVSGTWSDGTTGVPPVVWSASTGTISLTGLYSAPTAEGTYRVIARHEATGKADTSAVTVAGVAPVLTGLVLTPGSASVATSGSQQFSVTATWSDGATRTPTVSWSATGGSVTNGGLYVAGTTAGSYQVRATGSGTTISATAPVSVVAPTVTGLAVTPSSVNLSTGQTQQFSATATYSNGTTGAAQVTWSAFGGSITAAGLYTAGQTAGSFLVIAACACGVSDTVEVAVVTSQTPALSWPHQPSGMTRIAEDNWLTTGYWKDLGGDQLWTGNGWTRKTEDTDVVTVTGLPTGTNRAMQIRTPAGTPGGYGPWAYHSQSTMPAAWGSGWREVYFGYYTRILPGFYGHPSGSNKHANIIGKNPSGGKDSFWVMPWGSGTTTYFDLRFDASPGINLKNTVTDCVHTVGTINDVFTPGKWYLVEMWYRKPLTTGSTGQWKVWVDGVLVQEINNVCDYGYGSSSNLYAVGWHGTWGGIGDTLPVDNYQQFGPFRISARN